MEIGKWLMTCPTGGMYEAECKYQGLGKVDCHLIKTIKPCRAKQPHIDVKNLEEEYAKKIIKHLSEKYKVPEVKIRFVDECPGEPTDHSVFHTDGSEAEITVCRGGADFHKLAHEFKHYLQHLEGKPLDEADAEMFAFEEAALFNAAKKPLYNNNAYHSNGGSNLSWKDIAVIYGGQHIGKGVTIGLRELDKAMALDTESLEKRPSTWATLLLSGLPLVAPYFFRLGDPWDKLIALVGGYVSTSMWDYVEEMSVQPTVMPSQMGAAPSVPAPVMVSPARVPVAVTTTRSRYVVTD